MKNGFLVYDADTHVEPSAEVLDLYVDPAFRAAPRRPWPYRVPIRASTPGGSPGRHVYRFGQSSYQPHPRRAGAPRNP